MKNNSEYYYVYLIVNDRYVTYNNGHFTKSGYYLTDDINKSFYFGGIPTDGAFEDICNDLNINREEIQIVPDEHYETGLSNLRYIVYKRKGWD